MKNKAHSRKAKLTVCEANATVLSHILLGETHAKAVFKTRMQRVKDFASTQGIELWFDEVLTTPKR